MSAESTSAVLKRLFVGRPIPSHLAHHERFSRVTGLAVLSSDALSSVGGYPGDDFRGGELFTKIDPAKRINDFVAAGEMEMHTAGSLRDGQIVWALAKVKESFDLFGGDTVESYLLFTNPHKYGHSIDVRFTPIRVVCNNTLTLSLNSKVERFAKISHRREFNGDNVKEMLGIAADKLAQYKEMAAYLGSKRYSEESIVDYFTRVFPVSGSKKEISKNAQMALDVIDQQPGAEYAEGSWWQAFNAVTFMTDHVIGRNADNRLQSAWYGFNKNLKTKALETAVEFADAA